MNATTEALAQALRDAEGTVLAFLGDVAVNGSVCGMKQAATKAMFASLRGRFAIAQQASVPDQWRKDVQTLIAYGVAFEACDEIELKQVDEYDEAVDRLTTMLNKPGQLARPASVAGWVLVPRVPTDAMQDAYQEEQCCWNAITHVDDDAVAALWAAMLAAAPQPPAQQQP